MIPKIIHQTWKDKSLPPILEEIVEHNKRLLIDNGYKFHLWTDDEIIELIKNKYPNILTLFEASITGVQRGDIARILLVHHYGGIYIDLDILIIEDPINIIDMNNDKLYITYEPAAQTMKLYNKCDYLCNAFFAANAGNNMLNFAIQNMHAVFQRNGPKIFRSFDIFGGSYLKNIIDTYIDHQKYINIIENRDLIFPINDLKLNNLPCSKGDWDMVKSGYYGPNIVMVHYWIHGDFESKTLLQNFKVNKLIDIHQNMYKFFSTLYPSIAKEMLE